MDNVNTLSDKTALFYPVSIQASKVKQLLNIKTKTKKQQCSIPNMTLHLLHLRN